MKWTVARGAGPYQLHADVGNFFKLEVRQELRPGMKWGDAWIWQVRTGEQLLVSGETEHCDQAQEAARQALLDLCYDTLKGCTK